MIRALAAAWAAAPSSCDTTAAGTSDTTSGADPRAAFAASRWKKREKERGVNLVRKTEGAETHGLVDRDGLSRHPGVDVILPDDLDAPSNNIDHDVLDPLVLLERDVEPLGRDRLGQARVDELVGGVTKEEEEEEAVGDGSGRFVARGGGDGVGKGGEARLDTEVDRARRDRDRVAVVVLLRLVDGLDYRLEGLGDERL